MQILITRLCNFLSIIAGIILIIMVIITFADIVLRYMGMPIPGAYEIVAYLGVGVIGFALPRASLMKTHVYVDLIIDKISCKPKMILKVCTRVLVVLFFLCTGWYFIKMGMNLIATKSVSMTLRVPFYPVVFGIALSCFVQSLVSMYEIFEKKRGTHE